MEIAAAHGSDTKCTKETASDANAGRLLRAGRSAQQERLLLIRIEGAKGAVEFFPIEVVGIGQIGLWPFRGTLRHSNKPRGIAVGQRLDERGVDKCEDRDARTDSESQHQDGGRREGRIFSQLADGETDIAQQIFDEWDGAAVAAGFFDRFDAA